MNYTQMRETLRRNSGRQTHDRLAYIEGVLLSLTNHVETLEELATAPPQPSKNGNGSAHRTSWSQDEVDTLVDMILSGKRYEDVAEALGRTELSVRMKAQNLRDDPSLSTRVFDPKLLVQPLVNAYSDEELAIIREVYEMGLGPDAITKVMKKRLGECKRTKGALYQQAKKMGLTSDTE